MEEYPLLCHGSSSVLKDTSIKGPFIIRFKNKLLDVTSTIFSRLRVSYFKIISHKQDDNHANSVDLKEGDWVEVKPLREIAFTLDKKAKNKGLYFMPEMTAYCTKKFRILKRVERIKIESTGEVRKISVPTYFLENVYCKGLNEGCDRLCFHMWRGVWLRKVSEPNH